MRFHRHLDRSSRFLFAALVGNFALYGITLTIIGASVPQVIRAFGWSYTVTGLVLAAGSVGYFIFTFMTGILLHRVSPRAAMVFGLLIESCCLIFVTRSPRPAPNMALFFGLGMGQGITEVVTNYLVVGMEREGESGLMTLIHAFFCLGAVVGPFSVGALARVGVGWNAVYTSAGVLAVGTAVLFLALPTSGTGLSGSQTTSGAVSPTSASGNRAPGGLRLFFEPLLILSFCIILLYVGSELGVSNWIAEYFVREHGSTPSTAAYMSSTLWTGILFGRLILSALSGRTLPEDPRREGPRAAVSQSGSISRGPRPNGDRRSSLLVLCASGCTLFFLLALLAGNVWSALAFLFLTGFGYSGIYPLVMNIVGSRYKTGAAVGFISTGGGVGSLVFPFALAFLADRIGLRGAFFFCLFLNGVLFVLSAALCKYGKAQAREGATQEGLK
jgi:fucose permease